MDNNLLEKLAMDFCTTFIQTFNSPDNGAMEVIIGLHGARDEILLSLKQHMEKYFHKKDKEIKIVFGKQSYHIDVGHYLNIYQ